MSVEHIDVAAYSLGLLDQKGREEFETHLAGCQSCAEELSEFSAMADLFADLGPVSAEADEPDESAVADLLGRRAATRRRQTRQRAWLAAAAGLVLLAGGVAAGITLAPTGLQMAGQQHSKTNPASGLTGTVGLVAKTWGTQVILELSRLQTNNPLKCQLVAVSKDGKTRVMVGWLVPPPGDGVPGNPAPLLIAGGTWMTMQELSKIEIQVLHGSTFSTLLTIPI